MKTITKMALGAMALAVAAPAVAQDLPFTFGNYSEVTEVTIDDGHFLDYAKFLATEAKAQNDFAKAQGWLVDSKVFSNVHKRANEPDLYLMVTYKAMPDAAEHHHGNNHDGLHQRERFGRNKSLEGGKHGA